MRCLNGGKLIHENSVTLKEMFRVFNIGAGFIPIVPREEKETALEILNKHFESFELGTVTERPGITIENYGVKL